VAGSTLARVSSSEVAVLLQAVAAGLTLITARAALKAVRLSEKQWATATEPDLHLQVLLSQNSGTTDIAIVNVGGWARAALFAMSVRDQRASSYLGDGFVAPGERVFIRCELPQSGDTKAMLLYRGMDETTYRIKRGKPRETLSDQRERPETSLGREWEEAYPGDDWLSKTAVARKVYPGGMESPQHPRVAPDRRDLADVGGAAVEDDQVGGEPAAVAHCSPRE
jgi:hypothetical protein